MDSSKVNKEIKRIIKPYLLNNGFTVNTSRNFWRHNEENIFIINFQSYNSYNADVMNVTTFSFSINFGIFWYNLPHYENIKTKDNLFLPQDYNCNFRHSLSKNINQSQTSLKTVWYIDKEGHNLDSVMNDALVSIQNFVPNWFMNLSNKTTCLKLLQDSNENMEGTFGFGNKNSPIRNLLLGHFAFWTGKHEIANQYLKKAIDSKCFLNLEKDIAKILS